MDDLIARYRTDRGIVKQFMQKIPFYNQALENHEYFNADESLRKEIETRLVSCREFLRRIEAQFVTATRLEFIGKTESVSGTLMALASATASSTSGGYGLGRDIKPTPVELEKLVEYDHALLRSVEELETKFKVAEEQSASIAAPADLEKAMKNLLLELDGFQKLLQGRKDIFLKA